ncbi:MAG: ATP-binding protein [Acidobacteriota bacterium]
MTPDQLRRILNEVGPDFSAEICAGASLEDLEREPVERFRAMWRRKSGNPALETLTPEQLLRDAELLVEGKPTYAALILFGTREALGRHLGQAEVIFEFRSMENSIEWQQRVELRRGFFGLLDELWELINRRNEVTGFQDGLYRWEIPVFDESVVREAILNAVTHRDYRLAGSVLVRQYPRKLEMINPGGFPPGVTAQNILWSQAPRNRRIAEACQRCGLVERSGQGADRMFRETIRQGKPRPDYSRSDSSQVWLTLRGEVEHPEFLRFLEKIGQERLSRFAVEDLIVLDLLHREEPVWDALKARLAHLLEVGVIERIGRGRGVRYILSRKFYSFWGRAGTYTRRRGLDRETNKTLLLKHIRDNREEGARLMELGQVLPGLSCRQIQTLLTELRAEGEIRVLGITRKARWYPGPG